MITPFLQRRSDGSLAMENLAPPFLNVVIELPGLLAPDQPEAVQRRLYPKPSEDDELEEAWKKHVRPELFALVASAREIVTRDIGGLELVEEEGFLWRLEIPETHINAWLSALQVARLTLGSLHEIEETELEDEDEDEPEEWDEKRAAVARIGLLGWIQHMFVEEQNPPPSGEEPATPSRDP